MVYRHRKRGEGLDRREAAQLLGAGMAGLLTPMAGRAAVHTPARGEAVEVGPVLSADAFLDTIGVGAHWEYKDTVYGTRTAELVEALAGSGIRHVRGYDPAVSAQLAGRGLLAMLVVGPEVGNPEQVANMVEQANRARRVIDAVEGPNEADLFWPKNGYTYRGKGFPAGVLAYQRDLYRAVKTRRSTAEVLIVGPSLGKTYIRDSGQPNPFADGSLAEAVDFGNFHPYPFGGNSFSLPFRYGGLDRYYWTGNFPSVNIDEYPYNTLVYAPPFRPKPMVASETGYRTGPRGVSETVHAKYIPRLFAEYARLGVRRTYLYELANIEAAGPQDGHFGLLRSDASPKPAFVALRSLLTLIRREAGPNSGPPPVELAIEARLPAGYDRGKYVHSLVLHLSGSRYLLLLWHEIASADTATTPARDVLIPAGEATIVLPHSMRATSWYEYGPDWSLRRHPTDGEVTRIDLPLRDEIVVLAFGGRD